MTAPAAAQLGHVAPVGLGCLGHVSLRRAALTLALGAAATLCCSQVQAQPQKCKGTKIWHSGACRYPDEAAEIDRQRVARKEWAKKQDADKCAEAETAESIESWRAYLKAHPKGGCSERSNARKEPKAIAWPSCGSSC